MINQLELKTFVTHCCEQLGITGETVNLRLVFGSETPLRSAGSFEPSTLTIMVHCKNRAVADVYRTVAHELTHMKQLIVDKVEFPEDDEGMQKYENEANEKSGELVRFFGRTHPEIYADLM